MKPLIPSKIIAQSAKLVEEARALSDDARSALEASGKLHRELAEERRLREDRLQRSRTTDFLRLWGGSNLDPERFGNERKNKHRKRC